MLNKLKVAAILGVALQTLRTFFPSLDFGGEFEGAARALIDALYVLIPIVAGWFVKEPQANVDALVTS